MEIFMKIASTLLGKEISAIELSHKMKKEIQPLSNPQKFELRLNTNIHVLIYMDTWMEYMDFRVMTTVFMLHL